MTPQKAAMTAPALPTCEVCGRPAAVYDRDVEFYVCASQWCVGVIWQCLAIEAAHTTNVPTTRSTP